VLDQVTHLFGAKMSSTVASRIRDGLRGLRRMGAPNGVKRTTEEGSDDGAKASGSLSLVPQRWVF
jgi:hypothetical protein